MSTLGAPARWIQVVLAMTIGAIALAGGLGLVTIRDGGSQKAPADEEEATPATQAAAATPPPTVTSVAPPTSSASEPTLGTDRTDKRKLIVFMQPNARAADIAAVRRSLEGMADVRSIRFVDHAEAYAEMKVLFADDPSVLAAIAVQDAPVSFHVLPQPNVDRHVIGARLSGHQRVQTIVYPGE